MQPPVLQTAGGVRRPISIAASVLLLITSTGLAETVTLFPAADTALRSNVPTHNFGAATDLPLGVAISGAPRNRVLLRFDTSAIPVGATINSASLKITVVQASTAPALFVLHRVLLEWGEGDKAVSISGDPATQGEATWNARLHPSTLWAAGGGLAGTDYAPSSSATASLAGSGSEATFSSAQLASDLQSWVNEPNSNFGWCLMANGEPSGTGKRIGSREHPSTTARPSLTIDYTPPSPPDPPSRPLLTPPMLAGNEIHFSFNAEPGHPYAVEYRDSAVSGDWILLDAFPAQSSETTFHVTNSVSGSERYFRVRSP